MNETQPVTRDVVAEPPQQHPKEFAVFWAEISD